MIAEFTARAAVLGRQFDSYEPFPDVYLKGDLTMGENIADLGGALVALEAYHLSLGGKEAPVIDGLTGDQRFFLGYAQSWRHKSNDESIRQQIVANSHAPANYRVNGVQHGRLVRGFRDQAGRQALSCPRGAGSHLVRESQ